MESFYYISNKILNKTSYIYNFSDDELYYQNIASIFKNEITKYKEKYSLINILLLAFIKKILILKKITKVGFIYKILNSVFYKVKTDKLLIDKFTKIQKTYFAFSKLAYIYKIKKSKCVITHDLYFNDINKNESNVIQIYQNNMTYLFTISDLIHLLMVSLTNASHFFINPLECKNPYNNIPFSKNILYNIYFSIKNKQICLPELIEQFFVEEFDLPIFLNKNKVLIQTTSIKEYVSNSSLITLYNYGLNIFNYFNHLCTTQIAIHPEFPKKLFVDIMKPLIILYLISNYSIDSFTKYNTSQELYQEIQRFYIFNPLFGRKHIKICLDQNKKPFKKVYFNDSCSID